MQKRYLRQLILKLNNKASFHIIEFIMKMQADNEIMFLLNKELGLAKPSLREKPGIILLG